MERLVVKPETALVRPFVVAAILRGVRLDKARYDSFIDLQAPPSPIPNLRKSNKLLEDETLNTDFYFYLQSLQSFSCCYVQRLESFSLLHAKRLRIGATRAKTAFC